jgi:UDPglucose 6-dehydrogenase
MNNIGIIGNGFVGSAVEYGFSAQTTSQNFNIRIYDVDKNKSRNSLYETVNESDFIFVSVPTPAKSNGEISLKFLYDALDDINIEHEGVKNNVILIRATVIPGSTTKIQNKYPNLNFVFNPEFLTERSAKFDFINQSRIILGGDEKNTALIANLYRLRFGDAISIIQTNFETAEMIKYMNNCFFATKVSFMNEMKLVADKCNVDWDTAVDGFVGDGRIGHSHLSVPGPDGKLGFGGSCFPKDIQAMIYFGYHHLNLEMDTLIGAWKTNLRVRPEEDWKKLKNRAVVS